jgi:hypothetical protein
MSKSALACPGLPWLALACPGLPWLALACPGPALAYLAPKCPPPLVRRGARVRRAARTRLAKPRRGHTRRHPARRSRRKGGAKARRRRSLSVPTYPVEKCWRPRPRHFLRRRTPKGAPRKNGQHLPARGYVTLTDARVRHQWYIDQAASIGAVFSANSARHDVVNP